MSAVMIKAVADLVAAYTGQARAIDRNTVPQPDGPRQAG